MKHDTPKEREPYESPAEEGPRYANRPPVAPARVAAMKANYKQAWLYFLMIVCILIAWGIPLRYAINRYLTFRPEVAGPRDAEVFAVLAYEGVSTHEREVSPELFRQQVAAFRQAGFNPVTLEDVRAFYAEGHPLPRRALLLTFDHSRKSSYFEVRSILSRARWPAAIFLWTKPIEDEDPASLRWPYIRAMLNSGAWEVGAQSHRGFERVVADREGNRSNFMTTPLWVGDALRHETPEAFRERLRQDHAYVRSLVQRETGEVPRAFAFPYGDFGQYDDRALLSRRLNMDLVAEFYDLGFIHGLAALNTRYSDPHRLNRLLVDPAWSAQELVERLEVAWPLENGLRNEEAMASPRRWLAVWGQVALEPEGLALRATGETTGATAWLNGSDLFQDFRCRLRLRIEDGQVGCYLRATMDGEAHIYLGLGAQGEVWLRQKHAGMQAFTLGAGRFSPAPDGLVDVVIQVRGNLLHLQINGRPVFQEIVTLRGEPRAGKFGVSVWQPVPGRARADVVSVDMESFRSSLLVWDPVPARDPVLAAWLNEHATRFSHFAPPWLRLSSRSRTEQPGWDPAHFRVMARMYNVYWTPEILLEHAEDLLPGMPETVARLAGELEADGLFVNMGGLRGEPSLSRLTSWIQSLEEELRGRGLFLLIRLPPELERQGTFAALFNNLPSLKVAVTPEVGRAYSPRSIVGRGLVLVESADYLDTAIPLHYRLSGGDAPFDQWNDEDRGKLLRQEGMDAYRRGAFENAIQIWARWQTLEPTNAEPHRLVGDAYLRQGDLERAVEAYELSLDINPGQIPLVAQLARLLDEQMGRSNEAGALLMLYARLFPGNADILLARAEALIRAGRKEEAGELIRQIVADNPDDLEALAMLHGLLETPRERVDNLSALLEIGRRPGVSTHFVESIQRFGLLAWPESWRLLPFIEQQARSEEDEETKSLYSLLTPRRTVAREVFRVADLSDHWVVDSLLSETAGGVFLLTATPVSSEALARLKNSDTLHSGFVDTFVEDARGFVWLYARRSDFGMIRFGFDHEDQIFLQVWQHGRMLHNLNRTWTRPPEGVRLRLEVRGDGAYGFVDGKPAFGAPVPVPRTLGLGWWGVSPWAPQYGVAQASLRDLSGGPLPVTLALVRPRPEQWTDDEMVDLLRGYTDQLQVVAPPWFVQDMTGRVRTDSRDAHPNLRILARYYRMRLMPIIRSASPQALDVAELIPMARAADVDGFTALFTRMPDEDWFAAAEEVLLESRVSLLAVRINELEGVAEVREVCPQMGLFAGARRIRTLPLVDCSEGVPAAALGQAPDDDPAAQPVGDESPPVADRVWMF